DGHRGGPVRIATRVAACAPGDGAAHRRARAHGPEPAGASGARARGPRNLIRAAVDRMAPACVRGAAALRPFRAARMSVYFLERSGSCTGTPDASQLPAAHSWPRSFGAACTITW